MNYKEFLSCRHRPASKLNPPTGKECLRRKLRLQDLGKLPQPPSLTPNTDSPFPAFYTLPHMVAEAKTLGRSKHARDAFYFSN